MVGDPVIVSDGKQWQGLWSRGWYQFWGEEGGKWWQQHKGVKIISGDEAKALLIVEMWGFEQLIFFESIKKCQLSYKIFDIN